LLHSQSDLPFETFVQQALDHKESTPRESTKSSTHLASSVHAQSAYIGSESCRGCHADIYNQWSASGMAKMFRPYAPENVVGDFPTTNNQFYLGDDAEYRGEKAVLIRGQQRFLFARMVIRDKRHYFDLLQSDGKWHSYPVDYTIGSKWEQAYATKLPNGE